MLGTTTKRRAVPPPAAPPDPPPRRTRPTIGPRRSASGPFVRPRLVAAMGACALLWGLVAFRLAAGTLGGVRDAPTTRRRRLPARFPRHGSPEYASACRWAVDDDDAGEAAARWPANATNDRTSCPTSLVPWVRNSEGLSSWVCAVAQAYIYSRLLARQHSRSPPLILLEFEGMNITQAMRPPDTKHNSPDWVAAPHKASGVYMWCKSDPDCTTTYEMEPWDKELERGVVPLYRHAYKDSVRMRWIHEGEYDELNQTLSGFSVETGMGCALAAMWELSPRLAEHEPRLFTELLPALRDEDALVLSLYLRTQWTDFRNKDPAKNAWDENADRHVWVQQADQFLRPFVDCARRLEREYFSKYSGSGEEPAFRRIVWMVSSDSPLLKRYVHDTFRQVSSLALDDIGTNDAATFLIPREVVFTGSSGVHTKSSIHPSHADVAKAFVDWYLLGESDAVVVDGTTEFTFGSTAALRTARPIYRGGMCTRKVLVRPKER